MRISALECVLVRVYLIRSTYQCALMRLCELYRKIVRISAY